MVSQRGTFEHSLVSKVRNRKEVEQITIIY